MDVTQELVLDFLLEQGGKVKNSDLLRKFKPVVESPDPQVKANNRELFKRFVNNIAVVKDEEGGKVVVLKKRYAPLLAQLEQSRRDQEVKEADPHIAPVCESSIEQAAAAPGTQDRRASLQEVSEPQHSPPDQEHCDPASPAEFGGAASVAVHGNGDSRESVGAIVARMDNSGPAPVPKPWCEAQPKEGSPKPHMLPLRYAPSSFDATKTNQSDESSLQIPTSETVAQEASLPAAHISSLDDAGSRASHVKKSSKMVKVSDDTKYSDVVPLVPSEHKWLVNATNGRWNHVLLGLLMNDGELADKRDFIAGNTALHWAAKSGNTEMLKLLFDLSSKGGFDVNVNVKSFGGYTPLHIAAIHEHKNAIIMLVRDYSANVNLRDNSGKKPYHYLKKDSPVQLKYLLKDPVVLNAEHANPIKRNSKVTASLLGSTSTLLGVLSDDNTFHDLAKGFKKPSSLNKFFTAPSHSKKKLRPRDKHPSTTSLCEDPEEAEIVGKRRPVSEYFSNQQT